MAFYPAIRSETIMSLNAVVMNLEKDRAYLDHPDCPYDDTTKAFFRSKIDTTGGVPDIDLFEGENQLEVLDTQIIKVINDLEGWGVKLTVADTTDKMGYFRTKTALLEKLINMRERVFNIKEINDFKMTILAFMNEVLTKDQITDLMKRLDNVLGTTNDDLPE